MDHFASYSGEWDGRGCVGIATGRCSSEVIVFADDLGNGESTSEITEDDWRVDLRSPGIYVRFKEVFELFEVGSVCPLCWGFCVLMGKML